MATTQSQEQRKPNGADSQEDGAVLNIASDRIAFIILKARQYDGKEAISDPDSGSNAADDGMTDVLEDHDDDPARRELVQAIRDLNEDERIELVALAWVGRGTFELEEWDDACEIARNEHNKRTAQYLLSLPMLGDYLEEGLSVFGISYVDPNETN